MADLARGKNAPSAFAILAGLLDFAKPPEQISTVHCAEQYRKLKTPRGTGTIPWSRDLTPYAVGIMDALDDPTVEEVIVPKPGRCGGTVAFENYAFKLMRFGPMTDIGWYLKADNQVDKYCDREWRYLFELHPEIQAKVGSGRSDDNKSRKRVEGRIFEVQAATPANFTNVQYGLMVGDEIDSYSPTIRRSFKEQARVRGRALGSQRKVAMTSHPDGGWAEGIAEGWTGSSRGIYVWSCQNCGKWSSPFPSKYWPDVPRAELTYERPGDGATKDERVEMAKATAELTCPHCGIGLDDKQRHRMVDGGQWMHRGQTLDIEIGICGEAEPNRARGFWIHGTMSKMISNAELAEEIEGALAEFDATKKPQKLREVTAKVLGEPYEGSGSGAKMDGAALIQRRNDLVSDGGGFAIGEFPTGALFATQSIDVGHNKFDIGVWAWDAEGRSWLLERKTIRQRVWPDLQLRDIRPVENILDWQVLVPEVDRMLPMQGKPGWAMPIAVTLIDSGDGNVTWKAYEFCRQMSSRKWGGFTKIKPIKGNSSPKAPEVPVSGLRISKDERGAPVKPEILMFTLGVHQLREKALERLATDDGGPGECFFASGISRKALDEFFGERLIDGKWVRTGDNETLDCFDMETELLTENGWVRFADLDRSCRVATVNLASREIEYQWPTEYIARRHSGDMVRLRGRRLDILVTPNHRMVTLQKEWDKAAGRWNFDVGPQITLAKDLTIHHSLMMSASWTGSAIKTVHVPQYISEQGRLIAGAKSVDAVTMAAFTGWFVSEGCTAEYRSKTQGNVRRRVMISQNPGPQADAIRAVLSALPWNFAELPRKNGHIVFTATSAQLYEFMKDCGHRSEGRRVPLWIKMAGPEVVKAFLDAAIAGDGWHQTKPGQRLHRTYATVSRQLADDMQELFIKNGTAANVSVRPGGKRCIIGSDNGRTRDQYWVSECKTATAALETSKGGKRRYLGETVQYSGMVYCVTVPNGTLICRRNGKSFIAGNCFAYAEAGRQMLNPDRPGINWSSPPPWAKPVPLTRKGGDHAVEAKRQDDGPAGNQQTLLERFARLNEGN
ncbi:MAG: terminase gpA endonuclease subunit [Blastomonas fulva]|uniref:terminase gpA endonuclease subunit n=1 Tax=Blastomonas fulva TaxID=1550728 RepID=UPI004034E307